MSNNFQIRSLKEEEFARVFEFNNSELQNIGAQRMIVDKSGKFPCRISLEDALPGEGVILLSYQHHKTNSPYRATGPIFVRVNSTAAKLSVNEIPKFLEHRFLSLRAYNNDGMMQDALVTEGKDLRMALGKTLNNPKIDYVHIHNAKHGCYLCVAERA